MRKRDFRRSASRRSCRSVRYRWHSSPNLLLRNRHCIIEMHPNCEIRAQPFAQPATRALVRCGQFRDLFRIQSQTALRTKFHADIAALAPRTIDFETNLAGFAYGRRYARPRRFRQWRGVAGLLDPQAAAPESLQIYSDGLFRHEAGN